MATEPVDTPSGAFVSLKHDGFVIQSNTGTADDLRTELGLPAIAAPADGAPPDPPPAADPPSTIPTKARKFSRHEHAAARVEAATAGEALAKRERDEAKAEADRLKAELDSLRKPPSVPATPSAASPEPRVAVPPPAASTAPPAAYVPPPTTDADPEPKIEDPRYQQTADPYTAWLLDRNAWGTRQEVRKFAQSQAQYQGEVAVHSAFMARVQATPDFDKKFNPATPVNREIMPYLKKLDYGPQVLLYLSEHQDLAQRLTTLHPVEQIGQIGEIVGTLKSRTAAAHSNGSAPDPPPVTKAKPLVKPLVGGPSSGTPDSPPGDDASEAEHDAYYGKLRRQFR